MDPFNEKHTTFVEVLQARAAERPDTLAYRFLEDGETDESTMTFAEVDRQARTVAVALQEHARPGDRILLLYPSGLEYLAGFYGCMYGGCIAVPAYPPQPAQLARTLPRLLSIVADAGCTVALTTSPLLAMADFVMAQAPALKGLRWIASDALAPELATAWSAPPVDGSTIAFLQYTSGSTGRPKGVILSHAQLLANQRQMCVGLGQFAAAENSVVSWLPVYHDMGLIGNLMSPMWQGTHCTFMSPIHFLQRPLRWLRAITRYRGRTTGGPNFGYDLCVRKAKPADLEALDLSCWHVAYNGAERVRAGTMQRFAEKFGPCGFAPAAFAPVYGLAEATLMASGLWGQPRRLERIAGRAVHEAGTAELAAADDDQALELVSCGPPVEELRMLIVDPERAAVLPEGQVGEVWIAGPNVALGYWEKPEESAASFAARLASGEGPFMRSGDLGYLRQGELYLTGRLKDVVIIRGANYFPEDIEIAVERSHPSIRPGCTAAFAVDGEDGEQLVVVAEVERRFSAERRRGVDRRADTAPPTGVERREGERRGADRREDALMLVHVPPAALDGLEVREAICEVVSLQFQLRPEVSLLRAGSIPKTSSGKVQRHACKQRYAEGTLEVLAVADEDD